MAYSVSSWFIDQINGNTATPKRKFTIASSDYSDYVLGWPRIKKKWDEVTPQQIAMQLDNSEKTFNFIQQDKTNLAKSCQIEFGFTHPSSGDELITMFSGTMDKVRFSGGQASITLLDKFKQLTERQMGSKDDIVTFTNSATPPDIAWSAVTSYGGYSAVESTSNPDINYQSYLDWAAVFSGDNVYMNASIDGVKVSEVLKKISRLTQSAIIIEDDKVTFSRFSLADSNETILTQDELLGVELSIDDEDIVNRQYVYADYDVNSDTYGIEILSELVSSVNTYGAREQTEKDAKVWYVNSTSAINLADRIIVSAGEPYDRVTIEAGLQASIRQVGETISVEDDEVYISGGFRVMEYSFDMNTGVYEAEVDRSQFFGAFILDSSELDGTDVLT